MLFIEGIPHKRYIFSHLSKMYVFLPAIMIHSSYGLANLHWQPGNMRGTPVCQEEWTNDSTEEHRIHKERGNRDSTNSVQSREEACPCPCRRTLSLWM